MFNETVLEWQFSSFKRFQIMLFLRAAGVVGSILVILALVITLLKQIISFIGFLTAIIKILVIVVFVALFLGVALMIFRTWKEKQKPRE